MKLWESINDKAHDLARWVKGWGSNDAKSVNDKSMKWHSNDAFDGKREEEPDNRTINEEFGEGKVLAGDYEISRGIADENIVKRIANYEKISHSPSVKSLIRHIDNYEQAMKHFFVPQKTGTDTEFLQDVAETNGLVCEYMLEIEKYLLRKAEGYTHKSKRYAQVGMACREEAKKIRVQMDLVNKIQEYCFYQCRTGKNLTYAGRRYEEVLKDPNLSIFQAGELDDTQKFGAGQVNSVYKIQDAQRDNKERIFKAGNQNVDLKNDGMKEVYKRIKMRNAKDDKEKINTSYRDVAVSMIDKLFDLNAAVDTSFVRASDGSQASLMDIAAGKSNDSLYAYTGSEEKAGREADILHQIMINAPYLLNGTDYKPDEKDRKEIANQKQRTMVNVGSEKFVQSTFNLAALDFICGHVDRHKGNYMVSEQGVQGIDNDSAFSLRKANYSNSKSKTADYNKFSDMESVDFTKQTDAEGNTVYINNYNAAYSALDTSFPFVTEEFRNKIMSVSEDAVRGTLRGLLEEDEIEACVGRVKEFQSYLGKLKREKGQIVDSLSERAAEFSQKAKLGFIATYGNIMSQVRGANGGLLFERYAHIADQEYRPVLTLGIAGKEANIVSRYITRIGIRDEMLVPVYLELMKRLEEQSRNTKFDLHEELKSGRLDRMCKEIEQGLTEEKEVS